MKKVLLLTIVLCLLLGSSTVLAAKNATFTTSPGKWTVDFGTLPGEKLLQLKIKNTSDSSHSYTAGYYNYRVVDNPGDSRWIADISPNNITIPAGGTSIYNILISVPEGAPEDEYVMYVGVTDEIESYLEPITLVVRIGNAIPTYKYSIRPGYYKLTVSGSGEAVENFTLTVSNKGTLDSSYDIYSRLPDAPEQIDPEYITGDLEWIVIDNPAINIRAGESNTIPFTLHIPADVDNGLYKVWVGVQDLEATGLVQIEYACKLLITIDRDIENGSSSPPFALIISSGAGLVILVFVGWYIVLKRSRLKVKKSGD